MQLVTHAATGTKLVERAEGDTWVRDYVGQVMTISEGPQAYLVDMPGEGARISSHFHDIDQFQVVVGGRGRIGGQAWKPGSFHYADAFTPYGPILREGDGPLSFFTLRRVTSGGHFRMPESRPLMEGKRGRNVYSSFDFADDPSRRTDLRSERLLGLDEDGVQAVGIGLPPQGVLAAAGRAAGARYYIVFAGAVEVGGRTLPRLSLVFLEQGEQAPAFTAGAEGAEVLMLQFPQATARAGSDPAVLAARAQGQAYTLPD